MAHMMKHTKASCGHMFAHYDRREDNISNENLDRTRSHLNYNLATHQQMDQGEFVRKRCTEVHCQNRKDVNVMCSWVITAPKDLPKEQERDFFKASYDFLEKKYGRQNVVSSYVHMDEKTPHMHFAFVPVVPDERRGYKVSAKQCVNKAHLATFHSEMEKYLQERGIGAKILNNATREGNQSIKQLKQKTAIRERKGQLRAIEKLNKDISTLEGYKTTLTDEIEQIEGKLGQLKVSDERLMQMFCESPVYKPWFDKYREKMREKIPEDIAKRRESTRQKLGNNKQKINQTKEISRAKPKIKKVDLER